VRNTNWTKDLTFDNLYHRVDGLVSVSIVSKEKLIQSIDSTDNWDMFFISSELFEKFDRYLVPLYPDIIDAFRGQRTGWNDMFVIPASKVAESGIERRFLVPYVKSPVELKTLEFNGDYENYLFVCDLPIADLKIKYKGAYKWISRFKYAKNKNGKKTIQEACEANNPFWYTLKPKQAHIVTAINPFERFFFCYAKTPFTIDQRLVAITVNDYNDIELISALLNSIVTLLNIEMRGTSRNLGALDLNANYFKTLKVLNPNVLTTFAQREIKKAFRPLKNREIETIFDEFRKPDRTNFDKVVLRSFGIDEKILPSLYRILSTAVYDRVSMKER